MNTVDPVLANDEVPEAVEAEIMRCWHKFNAASDDHKTAALQQAAAALFTVCKINATVHPECVTVVDSEIRRELDDMAEAAFIEPTEAAKIYTKARRFGAGNKTAPNGHGSLEDIPPAESPNDYGASPTQQQKQATSSPIKNGRATAKEKPADKPAPVLLSKAQFIADFVPPDYLVDGVMQRRYIYSLTARTGDGKTALAQLVARLVSDRKTGNPRLGNHAVDHGNVVYFAGENPDDLRMRMIADDENLGRIGANDTIHIIAGTFGIGAMFEQCRMWAEQSHQGIDLVIVDTSAAYFPGDNEVDNTQIGNHARVLRTLTTLPGAPCVLVLCHPIKHATEPTHLLPRGGGAFIAEVDGNFTLWRTDDLIEFWWTGKIRGPGFEPMTFRLEKITCAALVDRKGRPIPSVRAVHVSDADQENIVKATRTDEDTLLLAMLTPSRSIAQLAADCGWTLQNGEPHKSKTQRRLTSLEKAGLARKSRGVWELTDKGKAAADHATRPA
jgi:AAA domain